MSTIVTPHLPNLPSAEDLDAHADEQKAAQQSVGDTVVFEGEKPTSDELKMLLDEGKGVAVVSDGTAPAHPSR